MLSELKAVVQGRDPRTAAAGANAITGTVSPVVPDAPAGGTATGQQIAADALAYQGHLYKYGGAPGTNGQNPWDCSSFVNYVLAHDLGLSIPPVPPFNDGASHGPNTILWLAWTGVTRIPLKDAGAGDIFCWQTHMGIATGPDSMISAQGPDGTPSTVVATGNIAGFMPGEVLFVLRLKETLQPSGSGGRKR